MRIPQALRCFPLVAGTGLLVWACIGSGNAQKPVADAKADYTVRPILQKYCLDCHSTKAKKGSLDLERFSIADDIRKDLKVWQGIIEQIEAGEMPPKEKPQPTDAEKKQLIAWIRNFLDAEAKARSGDPGHVPLRRLSNAEYNYTLRDLTGVDLQPAREFPADGAAGEGFTNAAEALTDISPALFTKYLNAAKDISEHAVLLPDGFRFSPSKTRRDWTDEGTAALRKFYAGFAPADGKLVVQPYLLATLRHRDSLAAGKFEEVAAQEKINAKYLRVLWESLTDKAPSQPLDSIRAKWRTATEKDVPALTAEITALQNELWRTVRVGSYVQAKWGEGAGAGKPIESLTRQVPLDPSVSKSVPLRLAVKPAPGQSEVTLYLAARDENGPDGQPVVWSRPRFEAQGKPAAAAQRLREVRPGVRGRLPVGVRQQREVPRGGGRTRQRQEAHRRRGREEARSRRGVPEAMERSARGRAVREGHGGNRPHRARCAAHAARRENAAERRAARHQRLAEEGHRPAGAGHELIRQGGADPRAHPGEGRRRSPDAQGVRRSRVDRPGRVQREGERQDRSRAPRVRQWSGVLARTPAWESRAVFAEGGVDLGGTAEPNAKTLKVEKGDLIILAVDAKNEDHVCDMTAIEFALTETDKPGRVWNLAADIATTVQEGNPHADKHGNKDVWSFVRGPSRPLGKSISSVIPPTSLLGKWRDAASDPKLKAVAAELAKQVQTLLSGKRPAQDKSPDRVLYDNLVGIESTLFAGVDVSKIAKPQTATTFGLPKEKFTDGNLVSASNKVIEVKLPAALFAGREFVVDAKLDSATGSRLVRPRVATTAPGTDVGSGPLLGSATGDAYKRFVAGNAEFRKVFPLYVCFPPVVPTDEVVSLKMFHREDEPLVRLFLTDEQTRRLDRLWVEQRFVSRQPVAEWDYLPQFMGFTTQDTPKEFQQFFIDRKPLFKKLADEFVKDEEAAIPKQLEALLAFAEKAYRRPLQEQEKDRSAPALQGDSRQGRGARRGVSRRVGAYFRRPSVPLPHRACAEGEGARPRERLGTGNASQLLPVGLSAGRRTPRAGCRGQTSRPKDYRGANSAHDKGRPHPGTRDRVRHAVDSRPRVRRSQ